MAISSSPAASPPIGAPKARRAIVFMRSTKRPANWSGPAARATGRGTILFRIRIWLLKGKRVLFSALGDGSVAAINARTGDPLWRVPLFRAGINATVLVHNNDKLISVFGVPYEPGQLVALKIPDVTPTNAAAGPVVIERKDVELWAADVTTSTSSPILVGDTVYVVAEKGDFCAVDANTGEIKWKLKLGIEQRNSSPLYADGRLYVPMLDNPGGKGGATLHEAGAKGALYIIKPGDQPEILQQAELEGRCFGTPVAYNGKLYLQTDVTCTPGAKRGNNPGVPKPVLRKNFRPPARPNPCRSFPPKSRYDPGRAPRSRPGH
jgi:outer membrane protein assembly factor BamB